MKLSKYINEGKEIFSNFLFSKDAEVVKKAIEFNADIETKNEGKDYGSVLEYFLGGLE